MAQNSKPGKDCKVTLGATNVLGMGTWALPGLTSTELDDTEFGDQYRQFVFGVRDSGTCTFSGLYKKDDTTGQDELRSAQLNDTEITDIRFYVDSVSYYTPNSTTAAGGGLPAESPVSHVNVTGVNISAAMGDLMKIDFTCRISGVMRLI